MGGKIRMTKELLKIASNDTFKFVSGEEEDGVYIEGYASYVGKDRDGEILPPNAIRLENFMKNPIILNQHNRQDPIGKCVSVEKREDGLWIKAYISSAAEKVIKLISDGILKAFSVGFRIHDYKFLENGDFIYTDVELFETSIVSIPCNQDALFSLCKSFNEENGIKPKITKDNNVPNINKEKESMNEEQLKAMQAELEAMKAEKARMEAEKAAKEKEAREAKEKAEKEAMQKTISDLTDGIKTVTEALTAAKEAQEAMKAEFEEKLEEVAKQAPKIEVVEADEKVKEAHMESYKDAELYAMLHKKEMKDTPIFQKLPERAKAVSLSSTFTTAVRDRMLEDVKQYASVTQLFEQLPSNITTDTYPFSPELTAAWGTSASDSSWTPTTVSIDYKSLFSRVDYNYVTDDEAIIAWMPTLRRKINEAIAEGLDKAAVNTTTVTNAYTSLPQWAINADTTNVVETDSATDIGIDDIDKARAQMGKYGVKPSDLALVLNSTKYLQIIDDFPVNTLDRYGALATIISGELGRVRNIPIFVNDNAPGSNTVSEYAFTLVNRRMFGFKIKSMMVEFDKTITSQTGIIVGSVRAGFGPLKPLNSGAITSEFVVLGQNPTA